MRLHLPSQCPPCVPLVLHVDVSRARPSPHFHLHALLSLKTAENKTWGRTGNKPKRAVHTKIIVWSNFYTGCMENLAT